MNGTKVGRMWSLFYYECNESKLNWSKANYEQMKNDLSNLDWTLLLNADNIEANWNVFKDALDKTVKTNVPKNNSYKSSKPIRFNSYIQKLKRKKVRLYRRMKATNSVNDINSYKSAEKDLKRAIRKAKKKVEVRFRRD